MATRKGDKPAFAQDGEVERVFSGQPARVWHQSVGIDLHNLPSYKLTLTDLGPSNDMIPARPRIFVSGANVSASDARGGRSKKVTMRVPGPLLDRLELLVGSEGKTSALCALADWAMNLLTSHNLQLLVNGSGYIDLDSRALAQKRFVQGDTGAFDPPPPRETKLPKAVLEAQRLAAIEAKKERRAEQRQLAASKKAPAKKRR